MPKGTPLDLSSGIKHCPDCKLDLPLDKFGKSGSTVHGYQSVCKVCQYRRHKAWTDKHPGYTARKHRERRLKPENIERYKDYSLKKNFGFPAGTYAKLLAAQDGKCGICQRTDSGVKGKSRFHVDHCHETNVVRGLLCHGCNVSIGHFRHSEETLQSAVEYLRRTSS